MGDPLINMIWCFLLLLIPMSSGLYQVQMYRFLNNFSDPFWGPCRSETCAWFGRSRHVETVTGVNCPVGRPANWSLRGRVIRSSPRPDQHRALIRADRNRLARHLSGLRHHSRARARSHARVLRRGGISCWLGQQRRARRRAPGYDRVVWIGHGAAHGIKVRVETSPSSAGRSGCTRTAGRKRWSRGDDGDRGFRAARSGKSFHGRHYRRRPRATAIAEPSPAANTNAPAPKPACCVGVGVGAGPSASSRSNTFSVFA